MYNMKLGTYYFLFFFQQDWENAMPFRWNTAFEVCFGSRQYLESRYVESHDQSQQRVVIRNKNAICRE